MKLLTAMTAPTTIPAILPPDNPSEPSLAFKSNKGYFSENIGEEAFLTSKTSILFVTEPPLVTPNITNKLVLLTSTAKF